MIEENLAFASTELFDDVLLKDFTERFFGYGRLRSSTWFIGKEEGGGGSFVEIARRIDEWDHRGRLPIEDVVEFHEHIGQGHFFDDRAKPQKTWRGLIRIALAAQEKLATSDDILAYQKTSLGRHGSDNCLLELLPLPSPSTNEWIYGKHSKLAYLASRAKYFRHFCDSRATSIRSMLRVHRPRVVVFYSVDKGYMKWWKFIAGVKFERVELTKEYYRGFDEWTTFVITQHPGNRGNFGSYFDEIGRVVAERL